MDKSKDILVTQPNLPPLNEFLPYLEDIWVSKWLTNNGKFHRQLEKELAEFLGVKYISLFSNGTLALMIALKVLKISGEVITTPYSFVATANVLLWDRIKPIFVDVDPVYGNLDPKKIEEAITDKTTAIMPVHVYGNPCEHYTIKAIAEKYKLKLIYDAAHAFEVKQNSHSILNYGDLSILSFHATKVFNTIEGGAIISNSIIIKNQIDQLKNFGYENEVSVVAPGINAKMNEIQAAFGLLQLKSIDYNISKRKNITELYSQGLKDINGIRFLDDIQGVKHNYSYFPIFIEDDYTLTRDKLYKRLKDHNIYCRRYFYPLISNFSIYTGFDSAKPNNLPRANKIAEQVICLPIYSELNLNNVKHIIDIIDS